MGCFDWCFFSLGGIVITNRANDRRLRAQLVNDRELRNRERELSLRKDVYLGAAEAISAGLTAIGRFANLDLPNDKITEVYLEKASSIAKIHVIAKEETVKSVVDFVNELGTAYLRLFAMRYPLVIDKNQLAILDKQIESFANERDRMIELMKQFNLEGNTDKRRWEVIQNNFKFEQERINGFLKRRETLQANLNAKQMEFLQKCVSEELSLNRILLPAILAVRTELELPINKTVYTEVVEEGVKKQEAALRQFLNDLHGYAAAQHSSAGEKLLDGGNNKIGQGN